MGKYKRSEAAVLLLRGGWGSGFAGFIVGLPVEASVGINC